MRTYNVKLTGKTPLLLHNDNIDWADEMDAWKTDPANKKHSKAGDDRSPAFRWIGCLYHDDTRVCIPSDNLMVCIREGGVMVPVPGGRSGKTFKSQTQSGMMTGEPNWPLLVDDAEILMSDINPLMDVSSFKEHEESAMALGFVLSKKRAKVGQSKHIRVRPRFDRWTTVGTLMVWDEQITDQVLSDILAYAGQYKGLGDWRPGGKTPGPWGMFDATVERIL